MRSSLGQPTGSGVSAYIYICLLHVFKYTGAYTIYDIFRCGGHCFADLVDNGCTSGVLHFLYVVVTVGVWVR